MSNYKIGLEFEGVIIDRAGAIVRWSKIGRDRQFRIKCRMDQMDFEQDPVDRYDCLAEVRTEPLLNPTPEQLRDALLDEVANANQAFASEGFQIAWHEMPVSNELHNEIVKDIEKLPKKDTWTLTDDLRTDCYACPGNLFRGGGIHINVSPIHRELSLAFTLNLHQSIRQYIDLKYFKSNYRHNFLYRSRKDESTDGEHRYDIAEYMSFGMNFSQDPKDPLLRGKVQSWNPPFGWCQTVVQQARDWAQFRQVEPVVQEVVT